MAMKSVDDKTIDKGWARLVKHNLIGVLSYSPISWSKLEEAFSSGVGFSAEVKGFRTVETIQKTVRKMSLFLHYLNNLLRVILK